MVRLLRWTSPDFDKLPAACNHFSFLITAWNASLVLLALANTIHLLPGEMSDAEFQDIDSRSPTRA